jgi:TonB-linked SusC/RagA family outer membrane protein
MQKYTVVNLLKCQFITTKKLYIFFCICFSLSVFSQQNITDISGKVLDKNGLPVISAVVSVKNTTIATTTDQSGKFKLKCNIGSKVTIRSVGYNDQVIVANESKEYLIVLEESAYLLDEMIVIGYGTSTKREVASAISQIKGEDMNRVANSSLSTALKGKSTGLRVFNTSGAPGTQASITVRGGSSINKSNEALVLVDGMPSSFSSVNPQDVESVEILKDAASTAIYGARASNGIILITTKSGRAGKITIDGNVSYGFQNASQRIDRLNAQEYLTLMRPALARSPYSNLLAAVHPAGTGNGNTSSFSTRLLNSGEETPAGWLSMADPNDPTRTLVFENNSLQDLVFAGGNIVNAYAGISGGSDRSNFRLSLGYIGDKSYTPNRTWNNLNIRSQYSYKLSDRITLSSNLFMLRTASDPYASEPAIFSTGIHLAPTIRSQMPDGTIPTGKDRGYQNPMYIMDYVVNKRLDLRGSSKLGLEWRLLDELSAKFETFYEASYNHRDYFEKKHAFNNLRPARYYGGLNQVQQHDFSLNYNKTFNSVHKVSGVVGASYLHYNIYSYNAQANGSSRDDLTTLNSSSVYESATSSRERETLNSLFGRLSYNYKMKLLLSASMRADGSSKFAKGNRWGYFPGVSVGYVMSEEDFMKNSLSWVSLFKLRTSYGLTGNNSVGRYSYQGEWKPGDSYLGSVGFTPSTMPNYALTWENTKQFDVGFEFGVFKNRLNFDIDYYQKITDNLLFTDRLPNTSGFGSIEKNIGRVKFWGYEFSLNANIINARDFKWDFGGNISYNLNKVLKLPDNGNEFNRVSGLMYSGIGRDTKSGVGGIAEGERLYGIIGYKVSHILDTDQEAAAAMYDQRAGGYDPVTKTFKKGRKIAGDYEWVDRNGDGRITPDDQYVLGYLVPNTTGGFNTRVAYKGFELYLAFDYALGHSIYDRQISLINGGMQNGYLSPSREVLGYWQNPGDAANTKFARFDVEDGNNNGQWNHYRTSEMNVYKGDYLSFREMRFAYSFPTALLRNVKISNLQLYLSGQNLYTFTAYQGYITEYSGSGRNLGDGNFPLARIWSVGLSTKF